MNNKNWFVFLIIIVALALTGCSSASYEEAVGAGGVDAQQAVYVKQQPKPWFDWSLERHLMVQLYVARNNALATFSYSYNPYLGIIAWQCPSIGMPIPGGTQLTNPMALARTSAGYLESTLPQAEPNGLYTPDSSAGTYVMCVNADGTVSPEYHEFNVEAAPIPYYTVNGVLTAYTDMPPSIMIDPNNRTVNYKTAP